MIERSISAIATRLIDPIIVHLVPMRSIEPPINGDMRPETMPILSDTLTWVRDQPNSSSRGRINRPNANCAVPSTAPIDMAETPAMYQPR